MPFRFRRPLLAITLCALSLLTPASELAAADMQKVLRVASNDITSLDPQQGTDLYSTRVTSAIFEALYEFEIPNSPEINAIYRLNTATGEVNMCYWAKVEGKPIGKTICDSAGENAGPQKPGVYGLMRSPYKTETGVYRVDKISGKVWLCFQDTSTGTNKTVCAAQQP